MVDYLYQSQCEYRLEQLKAFWDCGIILGPRREDRGLLEDGLITSKSQLRAAEDNILKRPYQSRLQETVADLRTALNYIIQMKTVRLSASMRICRTSATRSRLI